jgi:hypothetical protein
MKGKIFDEIFVPVASEFKKFFPKKEIQIKVKEIEGGFSIEIEPPELTKVLKGQFESSSKQGPVRHCDCNFTNGKMTILGESAMSLACLLFLFHESKLYLKGGMEAEAKNEIREKQQTAKSNSLIFLLKSRIKDRGFIPTYVHLDYNPATKKFILEARLKIKKPGIRKNARRFKVSNNNLKKLIEAFQEQLKSI